jgi:ribosomal protein S18 acetylase RimI-like enzyme
MGRIAAMLRGRQMIEYKQIGKDSFSLYDSIPMKVLVKTIFEVERINAGLGGFVFTEKPVAEYIKNLGSYTIMTELEKRFDLSNWAFFMAFSDSKPVGAASVVSNCSAIRLLDGRDDLSVLWDIRIDDDYKSQGIGSKLLNLALEWSKKKKLRQMKIECQNNNVPACRFYHKHGAYVGAINEYAYYKEKEDEVQLIWYMDLI